MQLTTLLLLPLLSLLTLTLAADKPCQTSLNQKGPCTCSCPYPFTLLYNGHDATNDMPFWCRGTEIGTEELNQMYGPVGYIDRSQDGKEGQNPQNHKGSEICQQHTLPPPTILAKLRSRDITESPGRYPTPTILYILPMSCRLQQDLYLESQISRSYCNNSETF
ncbi:MAG: hypothetical protein L6R36_000376 [Xanthoria steineri]|nr:MAG: hypothetical protein L6R36_000376 [Xanthoria steineri]